MKLADDLRRAVLQAAIEGSLTGGSRDNWRFVRLGEVISLISGADLPTDQHNISGNGTPYITGASNIVNGSLIINRWTTTPKKIAKRGDILLTCKGTIGSNCVLELEEAHIARQVMAIRVTGADTKFVHYYIQHYVDTLKKQAKSMIPGIERKNIIEAPFPLPSIDEQRRIVSRLDAILPLIAELEAAENELEALERSFPGDMRDSFLQAAIEGRLTGSNTDNWRRVRLGEIGEIIGGGTPDTSKSEYWHGQIAWITPADMGTLKSKYISHGARNITEKGLASSSARMMPKGSIIFSSRAPIGYVAIAENDLCTNQGCKSVILYNGILPEYVYFTLLAMRDNIKEMGSGTTFKEISGRVFSSVVIPLPPLDEQHKIVARLNELLPLCEAMKGE